MTSTPEPQPASKMAGTLRDNIVRLRARRERDAKLSPMSDRLAGAISGFIGSMAFVYLHLILYGGWIAINLGWLPLVPPFDPTFVVLAMEASVEAIFLSTFVLINQNRMAAADDLRSDLDLHVNLLAEHELTRMAALLERVADKVGVSAASDPDYREITSNVEPEQVLDALAADHRNSGA